MKAHDVLISMLNTARYITTTYLADLSDEELLVRPVPGAHHIAWQLGHLILSECSMLEGIKPGSAPQLPEGFEVNHSKEAAHSDRLDGYLSKDAYLGIMGRVREATRLQLEECSEQRLDELGPEALRSYAPTVGSVFLMIGSHEVMHSGQLAVVRRALGKKVVI